MAKKMLILVEDAAAANEAAELKEKPLLLQPWKLMDDNIL
jgi:hypothetical protein